MATITAKKIWVATDARKGITMKVNYTNNSIELTESEVDAASAYGSDAYRELLNARTENPGFAIRVIKGKRSKSDFAELNMKTIRSYVEKHGTDEQKAHFAFITKRTIDDDGEYCEPQSFFQIKSWFLNEFPEIRQSRKDYRAEVQRIYNEALAKAEAAA